MFQICVPNQKVQRKNNYYVPKFFSKIHNIINIIEISKSMEPNKCIQTKFYENVHLNVFYDFSKFDRS
jgi:hypothetical protein